MGPSVKPHLILIVPLPLCHSRHQTVWAVELTCILWELLLEGERGGTVTWVLPKAFGGSNETPAPHSLNTVAFKQAWHSSILAGALPAHLQTEKGAVESCFAIDFRGILAGILQFPSPGSGSGRELSTAGRTGWGRKESTLWRRKAPQLYCPATRNTYH